MKANLEFNLPEDQIEFNFAAKGGKYYCYLFKKYIEVDTSLATVYKIDKDRWIEELGDVDKNDLYDSKVKIDYREDSTNKDLIYNYIQSQGSQGSQTVVAGDLIKNFVSNDTRTMSKDTLYKSLDKLKQDGKIESLEKGKYQLKMKKDDAKGDENSLQSN